MANERPTLYVGMTNSIFRRVKEHKEKLNPNSFTARYYLNKLVYYEIFDTPESAIIREKQIKRMKREDKLSLIKIRNKELKDLYEDVLLLQ